MATIREMENRLLEARDSIETIMLQILSEYKSDILDLNREDQLYDRGITTTGQVVGVYSEATETKYGGELRGKFAGNPYNFKDTGSMFRFMDIEFHDGHLRIFTTDEKGEMWQDYLEENSISGSMFGLTKPNEMSLNYEYIKPELLQALKRIIYG